jgi:hypothetical protein
MRASSHWQTCSASGKSRLGSEQQQQQQCLRVSAVSKGACRGWQLAECSTLVSIGLSFGFMRGTPILSLLRTSA